MKQQPGTWDDQRVEQIIGILLRTGVMLSALIVSTGGALYLVRHGSETPAYGMFHGEPQQWRTLAGVFSAYTLSHGRGIVMAGLLVLILTPVARATFSLFAFALERDWLYVVITAIVLALLTYSLFSA